MKIGTTTEQEILRQIVRGERPLTDLAVLGMSLRIKRNRCLVRCQVENPRWIEASADIYDLSKGILANGHDPVTLRQWALFLQAADIDLDTNNHPSEEVVLNALWDAAFGNPLDAAVVATLQEMVRRDGQPA